MQHTIRGGSLIPSLLSPWIPDTLSMSPDPPRRRRVGLIYRSFWLGEPVAEILIVELAHQLEPLILGPEADTGVAHAIE